MLPKIYRSSVSTFGGRKPVDKARLASLKAELGLLRGSEVGYDSHKNFPLLVPSVATVFKCDDFQFDLFRMPKGTTMPVHDHPNMTVLSKLLFGQVRFMSYDFIEPEDAHPHLSRKVQLASDIVATPDSEVVALGPRASNLHTLLAIEDSFFFDILAPPYNETEGRPCTFYKIRPLEDGKLCVATKYPAEEFECVAVPYSGPKFAFN